MDGSRHPRGRRRWGPGVSGLVFFLLLASACGGAGRGVSLEPLDAGAFTQAKLDEPLDVRLSERGVATLNEQGPRWLEALAPGGQLEVPVGCRQTTAPLGDLGVTELVLADQGGPFGGRLDGHCDDRDAPAQVTARFTSLAFSTKAPDQVELRLGLSLDTGPLFLTGTGPMSGAPCDLRCSVALASSAAAPTENRLALQVRLVVNEAWDRLLAVQLERIDGLAVCGAVGASAPPACLDPADLSVRDEGSCAELGQACELLGADAAKALFLHQVSGPLEAALSALLSRATCQPCGAALGGCPVSSDGSRTASVCDQGVCVDPRGGCVPRFLGIEGRTGPRGVALSLAAGAMAVVDDAGVALGTRGGVQPEARASCVPELPAPRPRGSRPPDLDRAAQGLPYELAVAASGDFLDQGLWAAHQVGGFCVAVDRAQLGLLDTGTLSLLLPSLKPLARRDGRDAPMRLEVRPGTAPRVLTEVGEPAAGEPRAALAVELKDLSLDLYALVDDRLVRVVTLTADVTAPLALVPAGCDRVRPVVGRLAAQRVRVANAELLAEDPPSIAALLPLLLEVAGPTLSESLGAFSLPTLGNLKLELLEARGLGEGHVGLYTRFLGDGEGTCAGP